MKKNEVVRAFCLLMSAALTGCTGLNFQSSDMVPEQFVVSGINSESLFIEVDAIDVDSTGISNSEVVSALSTSLDNSRLFTRSTIKSEADYRLLVDIKKLFVEGVWTRAGIVIATWELKDNSNQPIWRDLVRSKYVVNFGDELGGLARTNQAVEGAMRNQIQSGFELLSNVNLE